MSDSGVVAESGTSGAAVKPVSAARSVLGAALGGLVGGLIAAAIELLIRARSLRDVALPTFLIVYPMAGGVLGWAVSRNPYPRGFRRPPGFYADGPIPDDEREERARRRRGWVWLGFGLGVAFALVNAALDFLWRGWPYLSDSLGTGMYIGPLFGVVQGFQVGTRAGDPKPSLRDLRLRMSTVMILTAYLALWLGLVVQTRQLTSAAKSSWNNYLNARHTGAVFQKLLDQEVATAKRAGNAEALRAGRIPDGLDRQQIAFLKSLDGTATEDYKKQRYALIADGEQRQADTARSNVDVFGRVVAHYKAMEAKYAAAAERPWLPVEPDPPVPK